MQILLPVALFSPFNHPTFPPFYLPTLQPSNPPTFQPSNPPTFLPFFLLSFSFCLLSYLTYSFNLPTFWNIWHIKIKFSPYFPHTGKTHFLLTLFKTASKSWRPCCMGSEYPSWQVRQAPTVRIFCCSFTVNGFTLVRVETIPCRSFRKPIHASSGSPSFGLFS